MAFPITFPDEFDVAESPVLDLLEWLRAYLLTRSEVTSFVGSGDSAKVYAGQMPEGETYETLIVLDEVGGNADPDVPIRRESVQFRVYGDTMANARELYKNVFVLLHGREFRASGGEVVIALEEVTGTLRMDPALNKPWWYMLASFEFILRYNTQ